MDVLGTTTLVTAVAAVMLLVMVAMGCGFFKRRRAAAPGVEGPQPAEPENRPPPDIFAASGGGPRDAEADSHLQDRNDCVCVSCFRSMSRRLFGAGRSADQAPRRQPGDRSPSRRAGDQPPGPGGGNQPPDQQAGNQPPNLHHGAGCGRRGRGIPRIKVTNVGSDGEESSVLTSADDTVWFSCISRRDFDFDSYAIGQVCGQPPPPASRPKSQASADAWEPPVTPDTTDANVTRKRTSNPPIIDPFAWATSLLGTNRTDRRTLYCLCRCHGPTSALCCGCRCKIATSPTSEHCQAETDETSVPAGGKEPTDDRVRDANSTGQDIELTVGSGSVIQPFPSKPQQQQPADQTTDNPQCSRERPLPETKVGPTPSERFSVVDSTDSDTATAGDTSCRQVDVLLHDTVARGPTEGTDTPTQKEDSSAGVCEETPRREPILPCIRFPGAGAGADANALRSGFFGTWTQAEIDEAGGGQLTLLDSRPDPGVASSCARPKSSALDFGFWDGLPTGDIYISPEEMDTINENTGRSSKWKHRMREYDAFFEEERCKDAQEEIPDQTPQEGAVTSDDKQAPEVRIQRKNPAQQQMIERGKPKVPVEPSSDYEPASQLPKPPTNVGDTSRDELTPAPAQSSVPERQKCEDVATAATVVTTVTAAAGRGLSPRPVTRGFSNMAVVDETSATPTTAPAPSPALASARAKRRRRPSRLSEPLPQRTSDGSNKENIARSSKSDSVLTYMSGRLTLVENVRDGAAAAANSPCQLPPHPAASTNDSLSPSRTFSFSAEASSLEEKPSISSSGDSPSRKLKPTSVVLRELNKNDVTDV